MAELLVPPNLREAHRNGLARYMATGEGPVLGRRIEIEAMRRDGSIFPVELAISRVDVPGTPVFTAYLRDISDRVEADRQLRAAEERYRSLVESLPAVVYLADFGAEGAWQYVSPQIEGLLEFTPEAWLADPGNWLRQIHPDDRELVIAREDAFRASSRGHSAGFEYRMLKRSGEVVWIRDEAVLVPVETGKPLQMRGVIVDITERKNLEDKLSRHAFYDTLTGLPNRTLFMERLEHAIARRARGSGDLLAVLFLDIDDFKVINDTLGHAAGDQLLASVARRLASDARNVDTPARFGGDEFTLLLEGLHGPDEALAVAERIAQHLAEPIQVGDRDLTTSVSVGIGMLVDDTVSAEDLVRQADIAMYRAKQDGKARAKLYDDQMSVDAWRRLELARELRRAIEQSELRVHYQPVVDLESGAIVEVEALVRWQHPERGLLLPVEFVPFAESNGLITQIDEFVVPRGVPAGPGVGAPVRERPSDRCRGQPLAARVPRPRARRHGHRRPAGHRARAVPPEARDHGERDDARRQARAVDRPVTRRARRPGGDRRLRDRVQRPRLRQAVRGQRAEDRSLVRGGPRAPQGGHGDRERDGRLCEGAGPRGDG